MAQLPVIVLFEFRTLKFCSSSLQMGSQVVGKMKLGKNKKEKVHRMSIACIKHVTCWMRFVYCNFGASWFDLWTSVRMRPGPKPVPGHYQGCKRNCKSLREGQIAGQNVTCPKLGPRKSTGNTLLLGNQHARRVPKFKAIWLVRQGIHHDMSHLHAFAWLLICRPSLGYIRWQRCAQIHKARSIHLPSWMG